MATTKCTSCASHKEKIKKLEAENRNLEVKVWELQAELSEEKHGYRGKLKELLLDILGN